MTYMKKIKLYNYINLKNIIIKNTKNAGYSRGRSQE